MYILLAILAFGVLIASHELGHFIAAKAFDVKVMEFSLGMGPALLKKQGRETLYTLRLLPIGGFCAMEGEDEDSDDPRAFSSKEPWKRMIILAAGAAVNFVLGFILVLLVFSQAFGFSSPEISGFMEGSGLEGEDAFQTGDSIYKIDGHRIYFSSNISEYLGRSGSDYHDIVVVRGGEKLRLENFHMPLREYTSADGGKVMRYGLYFSYAEAGFANTVRYSWYCAVDFVRLVWRSLGDLISGAVGVKELSGPVGIVDVVNEVAQEQTTIKNALLELAYMFALIAVNLAVMNMLPLPALDGGRIFFLLVTWLIELIGGKRIDPKYEGYVHSAGFVLLMGLMVFVMFNDITRIFVNR